MIRGNAKQDVFHDDQDRFVFLELLQRYKIKYVIALYHYAVMSNHVHLMVEPTIECTISKFMRSLMSMYSKAYNSKYGLLGHVWKARFCTIVIEADAYYLRCAQYIELNPVKAGMVAHPREYRWSSYRHSVGIESCEWMDTHPLLPGLVGDRQGKNSLYDAFIDQQIDCIKAKSGDCFSRFSIYGNKDFIKKYAPHIERESSENLTESTDTEPTPS